MSPRRSSAEKKKVELPQRRRFSIGSGTQSPASAGGRKEETMVHAPGHLREAFQLLVDEAVDGAFSEEYDEVFDDEPLPREQLLWKMANCSDIMPVTSAKS
ncbi:MAG: hypothetical protein M5U31_04995 [Acidimicrobiia bacterium]|nr:hypothetical protein [Acidimicrobiia bacterium]